MGKGATSADGDDVEVDNDLIELLRKLSEDPRSQFFLKEIDDVNKTGVRRNLKTSRYALDKATHSILPKGDVSIPTEKGSKNTVLLPVQSLSTRINDTQYHVTDKGQRFQADLADIRYLHPRAGESKYCLVVVDLYSQRVYLYGIYKKSLALEAFKRFLEDTKSIRSPDSYTFVQTDEGGEFFNKKLQNMLLEQRVKLFTTKMNRGHAFMAEQKIREGKKRLTKLKHRDPTQRIKRLLSLTERSMNNTHIGYLEVSPLEIEADTGNEIRDAVKKLYVGKKLTKHKEIHSRYTRKKDANKVKRMKPLSVDNLVWIAYGRMLKKHYRGALDKSTSDKKPNYYTEQVFVVKRRKEYQPGHYYYRLGNADTGERVSGKFYRDELYLL